MEGNINKNCKEVCNVPDEILKQLQEDVSEIKTALLGNKYNDNGLIKKQVEMESEYIRISKKQNEDANNINKRIDKINWTAGGISFGISFVISFILFILAVTDKI